jgi:hypothetical protein
MLVHCETNSTILFLISLSPSLIHFLVEGSENPFSHLRHTEQFVGLTLA